MTKMGSRPICVVHIHEDGGIEYLLSGDAVFLVVDERAPQDRVYQMTLQSPREAITRLLGNSVIGSRHDSRHAAVAHRIQRFLQGKSHLKIVYDDA